MLPNGELSPERQAYLAGQIIKLFDAERLDERDRLVAGMLVRRIGSDAFDMMAKVVSTQRCTAEHAERLVIIALKAAVVGMDGMMETDGTPNGSGGSGNGKGK
jgi:hypothetical protein